MRCLACVLVALLLTPPGQAGGDETLRLQGQVGVPFDFTPDEYDSSGFTNIRSTGELPPGISINITTGRITGTPLAAGTFVYTLTGTSPLGVDESATIVFVVTGTDFQVSPTALTFGGVEDGPPQEATVSASGGAPGASFAASVGAGAPWLSVSPTTGVLPQALRVTANPAGLGPGTYSGAVDVGFPGAPPLQVAVTFVVTSAAPPALTVEPTGLSFSFSAGATAGSRTLRLANAGSGTIAVDARAETDAGGAWLGLSPVSGNASAAAPLALTVTADPAGLAAGTYTGRIIAAGAGLQLQVPVTMTIAARPGLLRLSRSGLRFEAVEGGTPLSRFVRVFNDGSGVISWSARAETTSGGGWLQLRGGSGVTPASFDIDITSETLAPGNYYGRIVVDSPEAANSPQSLTVALTILAATADAGPQPDRRGAVIRTSVGDPNPAGLAILVTNPTPSPQNLAVGAGFLATDGAPDPPPFGDVIQLAAPAVIEAGGAATLQVRPTAALSALPEGFYRARIQLAFDSGPTAAVDLLLVVSPAAVAALGEPGAVDEAGCQADALAAVSVEPGQGFQAVLSQSEPLETLVVDNCGELVVEAEVTAFFSNGDAAVNLASNGDGSYSGDWNPQDDRENAQVTVDARQRGLQTAVEVGGTLSSIGGIPRISPGGTVNAASFAAQSPLPPGAFVSVFGSALAAETRVADTLPLPTEIDGVTVTIADRAVPLQFVAPGQINAVLPFGLEVNAAQQVVVRRGEALSAPEAVAVSTAQPAVFTLDLSGGGPAAALGFRPNGDSFLVGSEGSLRPGDVASIFGAGFGEVAPAVEAGEAAPVDPLSETVDAVTATLGGVAAPVTFSGLAPGFAGLYQINVVIPEGTPSGAAELRLSVSGQTSPPVTLAVE